MSVPLPPAEIRQGGSELADDTTFLESGLQIVGLLGDAGLDSGQHLVDFGCGPGRLAIALIHSGWTGTYTGVDVQQIHIDWCTSHITPDYPSYRFLQIDAANARYNPDGTATYELPLSSVDTICAWSVFSHMLGAETFIWLQEFRRILTPGGRAFFTAFVEDEVPAETENPEWYGEWSGPLHCVLYSTSRMNQLVAAAGLKLERTVDTGYRQTGVIAER